MLGGLIGLFALVGFILGWAFSGLLIGGVIGAAAAAAVGAFLGGR